MFVCSVRVEELSGDVYYLVAVPVHHEARLFCYSRHLYALEVLAVRDQLEQLLIICRNHAGHSLLRLTYSEFCTVEAFVLLRNRVEVDLKAVSQLAYGDTDSARTEVVAPLDHAGRNAVTEKSLDLALFRSITLLHLGAACLYRVHVVGL